MPLTALLAPTRRQATSRHQRKCDRPPADLVSEGALCVFSLLVEALLLVSPPRDTLTRSAKAQQGGKESKGGEQESRSVGKQKCNVPTFKRSDILSRYNACTRKHTTANVFLSGVLCVCLCVDPDC